MKRTGVAVAGVLLAAATGRAGEVELALHGGATVPSYEQSFRYDPGTLVPRVPGLTLEQQGAFGLDARGSLAAGAALAWHLNRVLGLEARIDTADVDVRALGGAYDVRVNLPPPLPDFATTVQLPPGTVDLERLRVLSLNLKLRTPGPLVLAVSGGASYLPSLALEASQPVGLGVTGVDGALASVDLATLVLRARADPASDEGRFGANAGLKLQIQLSSGFAVFAEGRGFVFARHTVAWERGEDRALSPLEEALVRELEASLEPIDFNPTFFQVVGGLAFRF
jgi:hypothetical protein